MKQLKAAVDKNTVTMLHVLQDITPVEDIRQNPKCDREIAVYGYLRGTKLKGQARVHIAGVGDATVSVVGLDM